MGGDEIKNLKKRKKKVSLIWIMGLPSNQMIYHMEDTSLAYKTESNMRNSCQ